MRARSKFVDKLKKQKGYTLGHQAEFWVSIYLAFKGYTVLHKRFKTPVGEVDIIARRRNTIAFIEVKARKNQQVQEVLSRHQQQRISRAAALFVANNPRFATFTLRFDLALIRAPWKITHIENAWQVS